MKTLILLITMFSLSAFAGQQFKTGSAEPTKELIQDLQKTYEEKIKGKTVESITVEGHTDQRGSSALNQKLSEKRAKAVADELVKLGADKSKIKTLGKGEDQPLENGTTDQAYATNRRVVVIVKSNEGVTATVISENKEKKCEEKERIVIVEKKAKERKNVLMLGARKDFIGLDKDSNGVTASVSSNRNLVPDISYMRREVLDSSIDLGIGIDTNTTVRVFGGVEF